MVHYENLPRNISPVIPWWIISGTVTEKEALRQLDELCSKGITEFFVYPVYGLEYPDFLSEDWFDFIRFLLKKCPERNMKFWIYDELCWPSGAAGGRLPAEHPEYRMRTLRCSKSELLPGSVWQPEAGLEYIWCGVRPADGGTPRQIPPDRSYRNSSAGTEQVIAIHKVLIDDLFFCSMGTLSTHNQRGIMDALNPAAVRCWMEYNYLPYEERFKEELGKTIRGFFYDEPTMVSPFHTGDIPWTGELEEKFSARYNYSCRELYWALFEQDSGFEQFRYDFWRLTGEMFADAFTGQLSRWCSKHGLMLAGHNWPEEPACQRLMLNTTGDLFYQQQYLHVPGTDFLFAENNYTESAGLCPQKAGWARNLIYSAKHPSSVARYNGAVHTLCESSGCLGKQGGTPAFQKIMYDFLYAMGISLMNPGYAYDMTDFRRYLEAIDAGQSYWPHYDKFADYMRTMSSFNSRGRTHTSVAVLSSVSGKMAFSDITPDTSIRQESSPLRPEGDCAEAMLETLDSLVRNHRDFELLFEDIVLTGEISENGSLLLNESEFKVIILPHCHALDDAVWAKLAEFARKGGTLIAVDGEPQIPLRHGAAAVKVEPLQLQKLALPDADGGAALIRAIEKAVPAEYCIAGENADEVLAHLRSSRNSMELFIANGTTGAKTITVSGRAAGIFRRMTDLQTGNIYHWNAKDSITLQEGDSLLLSSELPPADASFFTAREECVYSLENAVWQFSSQVRNTMRMALECVVDGKVTALKDTGNGDIVLDPDHADHVMLRGKFYIEKEVPSDLRIWFDQPGFTDLTVNGRPCSEGKPEWLFSAKNTAVAIADLCRAGENNVQIKMPLSKWLRSQFGIRAHAGKLLNGSQPLILMGSFVITRDHTIAPLPASIKTGSMDEQGFAQFADVITLETCFDIPADTAGCEELVWQIAASDLPLTLELNNVDCGVRFWKNGNLKLPENALAAGKNKLKIRLYGELKNMLGRGWIGQEVDHVDLVLPVIKLMK